QLDRGRRQARDAIIRHRRCEREACDQLAVTLVETHLELTLRGRGLRQMDRFAIAADLEVERELADRRRDRADAREVRILEDPARLHDVDQKYCARTRER